MAVIFYAVGGEGMGHATRSEAVINNLLLNGHKIVIFSYERAFDYLTKSFAGKDNILEIKEIAGVNFIYEQNEFKLGKTVLHEAAKIDEFLLKNSFIITNSIVKYNPNLIITDFEPFSNFFSKLSKIPLICIDNINFAAKCAIDKKYARLFSNRFIEYVLKFDGDYNYITTVFDVPLKAKYQHNTSLVGPIVRDYFYKNTKKEKDFILVYQTSKSNNKLFPVLKQTDQEYVIYGFNEDHRDGNLLFCKSGKEKFAEDLISCKGIITNGGFSLISEAVTLNKPIYSIPVKHQGEQEMNGYYIEREGWGITSKEINIDDLKQFLDNLEKYKRKLEKITFDRDDLFKSLEEKIELLVSEYKLPTRLKLITGIKNGFEKSIDQIHGLFHIKIKGKLTARIPSPKYIREKAKKMTALLWIKRKVEKDAALRVKIRSLGILEKYFIISDKEKISYFIYNSDSKAEKHINIVLFHGLGGNKSALINTISNLLDISKNKIAYSILLIDLAGHGRSTNLQNIEEYSFKVQSKVFIKIINREFGENSNFITIGHCYGSFMAVTLTSLFPERTTDLVLISSNPFQTECRKKLNRFFQNSPTRSFLKLFFKIKKAFIV
ncbi:MAG: alpha/beta fold hydrolase [Spirochaetota bacterium]|nr:alpha/beta fold hydrolase [Spirochaetota bacterium]